MKITLTVAPPTAPMTGKALAGSKRRRVVLATKVHGKMDDNDPNAWGNHRRNITQ